ncbi:unnamed protein product, partial [Iphiclides podalirius]
MIPYTWHKAMLPSNSSCFSTMSGEAVWGMALNSCLVKKGAPLAAR